MVWTSDDDREATPQDLRVALVVWGLLSLAMIAGLT